jgi:LPXTG-site transpeptidase (sortase) family protein
VFVGLALLGLWARTELGARAYQRAESAELDATMSVNVPGLGGVAVREGAPPSGDPRLFLADAGRTLGRLEIPRLGITAMVAEGVDAKTLGRAVGHVTATALPGGPGNCVLAGHRDTFLRGLGKVGIDDTIRIVTREHTYLYEVEWTRVVAPKRIEVLEPTPGRCVTLITCYPFRYIGHAPSRFIVRARQVDAGSAIAAGGS